MKMTDEKRPVTHWAPIFGRWEIGGDSSISYLGQSEAKSVHPFGVCVSDVKFSEGVAEVTVSLRRNLAPDEDWPSARILIGYKSLEDEYLVVGLGGYSFAYTISQFIPGHGWRMLRGAGDHQNLRAQESYTLSVRVRGQRVSLSVNGIRVIEHEVSTPLTHGQLGLFTWGNSRVHFSDVCVATEKATIFVVMQFSEPYFDLYSDVIQKVAHEFKLQAAHVGEVQGPGVILEDIVRGIVEAKIIVAEITPANPNVFYELGYAHALRKPTILLAEKGRSLPFDVSGYRCLFYENTIGGKRKIEEGLRKHLISILHE